MCANIRKMLNTIDKNWKIIIERDKKAKEKNILLGRYISHPFADGAAYY